MVAVNLLRQTQAIHCEEKTETFLYAHTDSRLKHIMERYNDLSSASIATPTPASADSINEAFSGFPQSRYLHNILVSL